VQTSSLFRSSINKEFYSFCIFFYPQIAPNVILTDEELENRQKNEYQSYVDDENSFLRELGILKDEDPLPET